MQTTTTTVKMITVTLTEDEARSILAHLDDAYYMNDVASDFRRALVSFTDPPF